MIPAGKTDIMNRALLVTCAVLSALCALQWVTLRRLKADLAVVNYSAAVREFDGRREEIDRVIGWLDEDTRAGGTGQSPHEPICASGSASVTGVRDTVFDVYVYLRTRAAGVSETDARQRVADERDQRAHTR